MPTSDWKANKKQGDVQEIFVLLRNQTFQAKEIGRKAIQIAGSISANNFIQIPHPNSLMKTLNLTGRYLYLEVKSNNSGTPFTFHFDFGVADRAHNVRVSASNLFKSANNSNGFVVQVPLELRSERWTVACLDITDILQKSQLFPPTYKVEGAHSLKSILLCANIQVRGVYTSDNMYDFITLPTDMRFKFAFDINKWEDHFDLINIPSNQEQRHLRSIASASGKQRQSKQESIEDENHQRIIRDEERKKMSSEIDQLLNRQRRPLEETDEENNIGSGKKKSRIGKLPEINQDLFVEEQDPRVTGYIVDSTKRENRKQVMNLAGLQSNKSDYVTGQYCGIDLKRSPKLNQDPILELKHIIGYSPDKCLNLRWSRFHNENVAIFTSGGTLIAMDVDDNNQKRFFFGHSAPICCFDINANGALIASAQEGKNSIIRIWEYSSRRCISMVTMPVITLKCLAFSYDGKYLASVGKDAHNKEMIIVWDITRISQGQKPEIVAKQTSDFNILCLRFSPIDSSRMASCGKENIRFWRIKDNGSIRGSAIVLNHHARNTIFTCLDFEYGFRSVDPKENESLKRVFVGSKHGMVFQINYHTESLEATYQTNDSAIFSIAVNEAFCVTGSEDTYLRVWPLDFSEFFMEAKHEGTVCAVDISQDGLKVVCGTLYGSLGILDKSNQKYRTLLRSHTEQILSMDFHLAKRNVITVSKDRTIRLWDVETFDQVYEFSSPIDQPLAVAAHPYLPLFSCGFESGVMRVFDIERTCVADEFSQFNNPLQKLVYSPYGDLLVTCCVDGGVAIHNPQRQHLPIKMMHLEFPPQFVHVAFSLSVATQRLGVSNENQDPNNELVLQRESRFTVMGEYGNNVNIYDSNSFFIKHQIQANTILRQFAFANNNRDLVIVTADCRVRVYSLAKYEGIFLRELSTPHIGNVVSMNISNNSGYLLTGGEDCMVKVWDYEASKTVPFFFQAFIGHTYPVRNLMFCPIDNNLVISAGEKDGIYLWSFYGDTKTQYAHTPVDELQKAQTQNQTQKVETLRSQGVLERLRTTRKETKILQNNQQALSDSAFILPSFKPLNSVDLQSTDLESTQETSQLYQQARKDRALTYNHYANCTNQYEVELQPQLLIDEDEKQDKLIEPTTVNGYDGFGGVHDNLVWDSQGGWLAYTLHNKVIFENSKTREQQVLTDSTTQLSTLVLSNDKRLLAVGEGRPNKTGNSYIFLYDTNSRSLVSKLTFHQRGIQSLAFSNDAKYLISIGVQGENTLAVWDLSQGLVIKSSLIRQYAVNQVKVDPYIDDGHIQFVTVGNQGAFSFWRLDLATQQLQTYDVEDVPQEFQVSDFTAVTFTQFFGAPYNTYLIILSASDGSMTAYDQKANQFVDYGTKKWCISGEIGHIRSNNNSIVIASSTGTIARYSTANNQVFPQDSRQVQVLKAESSVVSLAMDDLNNEGIAGTSSGAIFYLNFAEKLIIRIVSKVYHLQKEITQIKVCEQNPQLILTNCSESGSTVKLWTSQTLDQVIKFNSPTQSPVAFILSSTNGGKFSVIGHQSGLLRLVHLETLKVESNYQIQTLSTKDEEILTTAVFNPNGINIAVGTSLGNIYFGSIRVEPTGQSRLTIGKVENFTKSTNAITSLQFSVFDPIGSFLVAFDNGTIKTWQSSIKNEQFLKLMEIQQQQQQLGLASPAFDLSECGYQQFDLIDNFDMFENPHGLDELGEEDRAQLKLLYTNKKNKQCEARFAPGKTSVDIYYAFVSSLQYIYVRNYAQNTIVKRVSLLHFPTCFSLLDYNSLLISEEQQRTLQGGEQVMLFVGSKEGKVLIYKVASTGAQKLSETKGGLSYGSVTAIDVCGTDKVVFGTASGELMTLDILQSAEEDVEHGEEDLE